MTSPPNSSGSSEATAAAVFASAAPKVMRGNSSSVFLRQAAGTAAASLKGNTSSCSGSAYSAGHWATVANRAISAGKAPTGWAAKSGRV